MASVSIPFSPAASRRRRIPLQTIAYWGVLGLLVLLVIYPIARIVLTSFQTNAIGEPVVYGLQTWQHVLSQADFFEPLLNTLAITFTREVITLTIGIPFAWILARTDVPWARGFEFIFWVAFILPGLPVTLGWILLLEPSYGLLNQWAQLLPWVDSAPFNIYSFWGIIWAHVAHDSIAIKIILLIPALRYMDSSLEEASRMSGSSTLGTLVRIIIPIMLPTIAVVSLLSIINALQTFEIEMILGLPFRFYVFSSQIYLMLRQDPPLFNEATVLSSSILTLIVPLILLQRWVVGRRRYTTVGGQFRGNIVRLGRWRTPAFVAILTLALTVTAVPLSMLVMGSFMKLFGFFNLPEPWTLNNWTAVLSDPVFLASLRNTLVVSSSVAILAVLGYSMVAYIAVRTNFRARSVVDFIAWLPSTLPGVILGLGMLSAILSTFFLRPLYGTIGAVILAVLVAGMTLGTQTIKGNLLQISKELEEAAWVSGGSWWYTMSRIILPIIAPILLLVGSLAFATSAREVANSSLLATSATLPLSLLQLNYLVGAKYAQGTVIGVLLILMSAGVAVIARVVGSRYGIKVGADQGAGREA